MKLGIHENQDIAMCAPEEELTANFSKLCPFEMFYLGS